MSDRFAFANATTTLNNATTTAMISAVDDNHHGDDMAHGTVSSEDAFVKYFALEAVSSMLTSGVETHLLASGLFDLPLSSKGGRKSSKRC